MSFGCRIVLVSAGQKRLSYSMSLGGYKWFVGLSLGDIAWSKPAKPPRAGLDLCAFWMCGSAPTESRSSVAPICFHTGDKLDPAEALQEVWRWARNAEGAGGRMVHLKQGQSEVLGRRI